MTNNCGIVLDASVLRVWRLLRRALCECPDQKLAVRVYQQLIDSGTLGRMCLRAKAEQSAVLVTWHPMRELQLLELRDALLECGVSACLRERRVNDVLVALQQDEEASALRLST